MRHSEREVRDASRRGSGSRVRGGAGEGGEVGGRCQKCNCGRQRGRDRNFPYPYQHHCNNNRKIVIKAIQVNEMRKVNK